MTDINCIDNLGELIREAREEKGWTQNQLAYNSGTSPATVSYTENNLNIPQRRVLRKLSQALGISWPRILELAKKLEKE